MPLDGWDHVELWVGNAKQSAYFYEHAFGFTRTAYAGPETGVRDRASYVLEQGEIRLVVTSGLRNDSEITQFACRHGDAAKNIALQVPSAAEAYRQAVQRGARGIAEPRWVEDDFGRVELAAIGTYGDVDPHLRQPPRVRGPVPARLRLVDRERPRRRGRRPDRARPRRRQRRARPHEPLGRVLRARLRDDEHRPLRRRPDPDRVLGADVEGDGGRQRQDQVPDQRAGRGQAQEPDRGVPRVQPRPGRAAHRAAERGHRPHGRGAEGARRALPRHAGRVLRRGRGPRRRDRRGLRRPAAAEDPGRPRRGRLPAADLHEDGAGPADGLLRGDRAPRRDHASARATSRRSSSRSSASRRSAATSSSPRPRSTTRQRRAALPRPAVAAPRARAWARRACARGTDARSG